MATELTPNEGKKGVTVIDGVSYQRLPIKTHLITENAVPLKAGEHGMHVFDLIGEGGKGVGVCHSLEINAGKKILLTHGAGRPDQ